MRMLKVWLGLLLMLGAAAGAQAAEPVEGRDYLRMSRVHPTSHPDKVVVTEFFSYQCSHCYSFSKPFAAWSRKQPADVLVERASAGLGNRAWEPSARAYYTFIDLKLLPKLDDAYFDAIHRQRLRLDTEQAIAQWAGTQGVDTKQFLSVYRSFSVDTQVKSADQRARAYQVPSIPTLVIDGRFIFQLNDNGTFPAQFALIDKLIVKARAEKRAR